MWIKLQNLYYQYNSATHSSFWYWGINENSKISPKTDPLGKSLITSHCLLVFLYEQPPVFNLCFTF